MSRGRQLGQPIAGVRVRPGTRVSLFGGLADGRVVEVQFVEDSAAVYLTRAGEVVALAPDATVRDGEFLGIYEFVGPRGPERPVFVHRVGARRPLTEPRRQPTSAD